VFGDFYGGNTGPAYNYFSSLLDKIAIMQIDPVQGRMRWAIGVGLVAYYISATLIAVVLVTVTVLLHVDGPRQEWWILVAARIMGLICALIAGRVYWTRSIRQGRLIRGLCPACGHDLSGNPEMCPGCEKVAPKGKSSR
jgi:hypothetical protein